MKSEIFSGFIAGIAIMSAFMLSAYWTEFFPTPCTRHSMQSDSIAINPGAVPTGNISDMLAMVDRVEPDGITVRNAGNVSVPVSYLTVYSDGVKVSCAWSMDTIGVGEKVRCTNPNAFSSCKSVKLVSPKGDDTYMC